MSLCPDVQRPLHASSHRLCACAAPLSYQRSEPYMPMVLWALTVFLSASLRPTADGICLANKSQHGTDVFACRPIGLVCRSEPLLLHISVIA